jgi:hypothetical protein
MVITARAKTSGKQSWAGQPRWRLRQSIILRLCVRCRTYAGGFALYDGFEYRNLSAAVTLGFVDDVGKVDAAANPTYAPGQKCANCEQFLGKPSDARGGCVLFSGKSVPAVGWCKVWRKKP